MVDAVTDSPLVDAASDFTPDPEGRWPALQAAAAGSLRHAPLVAALTAHLVATFVALGGLELLASALAGRPPADTASRQRTFGDEKGKIEGVAAEVIDAAEFNRRFVSFDPGRAEADSKPKPEAKARDAQTPAKAAAEPPDEKAAPADGWAPSAAERPQEQRRTEKKREKPADKPAEKPITEEEIKELLAQASEDLQGSLVSVSTPGGARFGEANPFVRSAVRKLKEAMPRPRGMKGTVLVRFLIAPSGAIEALRVVRSSGNPALDKFVAERVFATRLPPPPRDMSDRDRTFQIAYEYR